jgi:3-oxoacyl-[acyl-carrier protein] reductase
MSTDRIVAVNGSSSGIGFATCKLLAERGSNLLLIGRDLTRLQITKNRLSSYDVKVLHSQFRPEFVNEDSPILLDLLHSNNYELSGLVLCGGGIRHQGTFNSLSLLEWENTLKDNLLGSVGLLRCLSEKIVLDKSPVVFVSSFVATHPGSWNPHYSTAKAGLNNLMIHLARIWSPLGVCVNSVSPGYTDTEGFNNLIEKQANENSDYTYKSSEARINRLLESVPIARLIDPVEVARVILFLLTNGNGISGANIKIDGGLTTGARKI